MTRIFIVLGLACATVPLTAARAAEMTCSGFIDSCQTPHPPAEYPGCGGIISAAAHGRNTTGLTWQGAYQRTQKWLAAHPGADGLEAIECIARALDGGS